MTAPRIVVAGAAGDSGKTLVSLALIAEARARGLGVQAFKKGPDYIDAAWLTAFSGRPARNLDTWLMGFDGAAASFARYAGERGINLVEGNRGLFDGMDARGSHSTAALAKALDAPVVLVLNATKMTGTAAAIVRGCQALDPEVRLAGVVLNYVNGKRHERVLREAVESACGIPVVGAVPRLPDLLPERHLGLVTPEEHPGSAELMERVRAAVTRYIDFEKIRQIAEGAAELEKAGRGAGLRAGGPAPPKAVTIGYIADSAFTFYYPENLEALAEAGARLVPVSAIHDRGLPEIDLLYIGGGFPETHGRALVANHGFLEALRRAAEEGLPIYAECGGLMLLARGIRWKGEYWPMAGVLPFDVEVCLSPQGHGYAELEVDAPNPFFAPGTVLRGHEFHYSRIVAAAPFATACAVRRGSGTGAGRDAAAIHRVWAAYTHLHAAATPAWTRGLVAAARSRQKSEQEVLLCPSQ